MANNMTHSSSYLQIISDEGSQPGQQAMFNNPVLGNSCYGAAFNEDLQSSTLWNLEIKKCMEV